MIRTVSMLPAATEIVAALGLIDQLVGVAHECDFPPEVNTKPRVTRCEIHEAGLPSAEIDRWVSEKLHAGESLYTIDAALLDSLAPQLILTQKLCDVCAPAYGSVAALAAQLPSCPRVLNLEPRCLADVLRNIREVAAAMGHADRADRVIVELERRITDVVDRVAGLPCPTVFVMEWCSPIFNAGHWTPELVRLAGGKSVLTTEGKDSVRAAWEDLRAVDPEILLIACCGHGVERTRQDMPLLESLPGWHDMRAVRDRRVYLADGSAYFSRPGPRLVDSLEILATVQHQGACRSRYPDRGVVAAY